MLVKEKENRTLVAHALARSILPFSFTISFVIGCPWFLSTFLPPHISSFFSKEKENDAAVEESFES